MPTVGNQEFPYTETGMADAEMAAAGIDPMQQAAEMGLGGEELPMTMEEGEDAGRGGDVVLAHMTPGEVVIPAEIAQDPEVFGILNEIFTTAETDIAEFTVGDPMNKINPETGYPEFGFFSKVWRKVSSPFKRAMTYPARQQAEKERRYYEQEAARSVAESRKMMAEQKAFFTSEMKAFQARQAAETSVFNKKMAEDQQRTKVLSMKNKRNFADTLFNIQTTNAAGSPDVVSAGTSKSPKEFSAPRFYGSNKKTKTSPRFKRSSGGRASSVRPR